MSIKKTCARIFYPAGILLLTPGFTGGQPFDILPGQTISS